MQIDGTGFKEATLTEYLEYCTSTIRSQGTFGDNYTIKKEGVLDNILTTFSNAMISLEDKIAYLCKQKNPLTAEGTHQDELYALINKWRNFGTFTKVIRTISGSSGSVCNASSIVFRTEQGDQFYLNSAITIGENGTAKGSFTAYELGAIACDEEGTLTLISAPTGVTGVYFSDGDTTTIGDDYEDDSEFRQRWVANQSQEGSYTEGGLLAALLKLVDNNPNNLKIRQNRNEYTYSDLPLTTIEVVINTSESDNTIATTIFKNLMDGVGMYGSTSIVLQDSVGTDVDINFTRAKDVEIYFYIEVILQEGYLLSQVIEPIQQTIEENFSADMGEKVIANDYIHFVNMVEGVDYVTTNFKIKRSNGEWSDIVLINYNEFASCKASNITVVEGV